MTAKELARLDKVAGSFVPELETALETTEESTSLIYSMVYSAMPRFAQAVMPSPASAVAPVPAKDELVKTLQPNQLKGLLITLASKGLLSGVGEGSPNLLAFNNATSVPSHKSAFVESL
jgi:cerevisin